MSTNRLLHVGVVLAAVVGPLLSVSRVDAAYSDQVAYLSKSVQCQLPKAELPQTPASPTPIYEDDITHHAISSHQNPYKRIASEELVSVSIEIGIHDFQSTNQKFVVSRPTLLTSHVLLRI